MPSRKKSATIICSANGSSAPTATTSLGISVVTFSYTPHRLTNWLPHIQRFKASRSSIRFTPRSLLLDVMEESDDISQATATTLSLRPPRNGAVVQGTWGLPSNKREVELETV
jgi:hypothetical protein